MCFAGPCDACGQPAGSRAYVAGLHLCATCAEEQLPEPTPDEIEEARRVLARLED